MKQTEQKAEISLPEIWDALKLYKRVFLIAPAICGLIAYILVTYVLAPTWETSAILQVGQVGQISGGAKPVETIQNVVSRMQHNSFATEMLSHAKIQAADLTSAKIIYKSTFKAAKVKDADLIEFKLRGYSPQMARELAENTVSYLQKIHDEIMVTNLTRIKAQIQITNEEIESVKEEEKFLKKRLQENHNWNSFDATLAATVLQKKEEQLAELMQKRLLLIDLLSPSITFSTKTIGELSVSDEPVSPKKSLFIAIAIVFGLLGTALTAYIQHFVMRKDAQT